MTSEAIKGVVLGALARVAPEADLGRLDPRAAIRDEIDLDSVDFMNFVITIHTELGIDIPEADYPKLVSVEACVVYLTAHGAT